MGKPRQRNWWLFLLILAVAACFFTLHFRPVAVQIYYPEKNNLFLVPVTRWVPRVTPEVLLAEIEKPPRLSVLLPALPAGFPIQRVSADGDSLVVEFSKNPDLENSPLAEKALLATFKQIPRISTIKFLVNGNADAVSNGMELGRVPLSAFLVNNTFEPDLKTVGQGQNATLYYFLKDTQIFVPITEPVSSKLPIEEAIPQTLQEAPPFAWALSSPLPAGSRVSSARRASKSTIEVTLALSGSPREQKPARKALVLTYTEIPSVRRVILRESGTGFWERWAGSTRPAVINKEEGNR